jgi:hypothetical protein
MEIKIHAHHPQHLSAVRRDRQHLLTFLEISVQVTVAPFVVIVSIRLFAT